MDNEELKSLELKKQIGQAVKALREEKGLTRKNLAKASGLSVEILILIEEDFYPDVLQLGAVAEGLGIPLSELIHRAESFKP